MSAKAIHKATLIRPVVADWSKVVPGGVYTTDDLSALLGATVATVIRRAREGQIRHLPRLTKKAPFRFLGAEILKLLGDQAADLHPRPAETPTERAGRARAAAERIERLARNARVGQ